MKVLRKLLGIEVEGQGKVFSLLALGFCVGICNVTFLVQSSSAFLNTFDEKKDLPEAIIASGILGVITAWLFSFFQTRISFFRLSCTILSLLTILMSGLRLGHDYANYSRELIFCSFILITPISAITLLVFWGLVGRLFNIKQAKKILGSIDSGQMIGTILTSFSIPIVLSFMEDSNNLLIICGASLFCTLFIFLLINKKYSKELGKETREEGIIKVYKYSDFPKNKYVVAMCAFIIIAMVSATFIDYSFLQVTAQHYPNAKDLASFLAKFEGTILIFTFLVQTFVTDRIISTYGIKMALIVTPLVTLIFTVLAAVIGLLLEFGSTLNAFIYFFLAISLSKLFITALKDSIDGPAFKLYFLPFDSSFRLDIQTKIEGVVKMAAGFLAGIILVTIEFFPIISVHQTTLFLLVFIAVWIYIANKLHKKYQETLQSTLFSTNTQIRNYKTEYAIGSMLKREMETDNVAQMLHTLKIVERVYPVILEETLLLILKLEDSDLKKYATEKVEILNLGIAERSHKDWSSAQNNFEEITKLKEENIENFNSENPEGKNILKLVKSKDLEDRKLAAKLVRNTTSYEEVILLNELMHDFDSSVVQGAIYSAKFLKREENWSSLIELLSIPQYCIIAAATLAEAGDPVISKLEHAFYKSGQKEIVMSMIVHILGQMGTLVSISKLWTKVTFPDIRISNQILRAFNHLKVKPKAGEIIITNTLLENEIKKAAWNISAQAEIGPELFNDPLKQALEEELTQNFDTIFILLSLIYEDKAIQLVRDNLESGTTEGSVFALELLELFLAKDIKALLFPVLEDSSREEKIRNLQVHFPREIFSSVDVLKQIINRDYNSINRWTKACALYSYALTAKASVCDDVIANLFNPNLLLKETAGWAILEKDVQVFDQVYTRLFQQKRNTNTHVLKNLKSKKSSTTSSLLRVEQIVFLKKLDLFANVPGDILSEFIEEIQVIDIQAGTTTSLSDLFFNPSIYILYAGTLELFSGNDAPKMIEVKGIWNEAPDETIRSMHILAKEDCIIMIADKTKLYGFMGRYYQVIEGLLKEFHKKSSSVAVGDAVVSLNTKVILS